MDRACCWGAVSASTREAHILILLANFEGGTAPGRDSAVGEELWTAGLTVGGWSSAWLMSTRNRCQARVEGVGSVEGRYWVT